MKRPVVIRLLVTALVLVLIGIGATIYFSVRSIFSGNNPFETISVSSIVEESKTLNVNIKEPLTLSVIDDSGNVTITGGDVDTVQVEIIKTAYNSTQDRADEDVKNIKYTIEQNGNNITFKYEIPNSMNFNDNINSVDFILTVPIETIITIDANFGEINVSGVAGNADIKNDFGNITIADIEGALVVDNNSGEIDVHSINAGSDDINISTDFGKLTLEQVNGNDITVTSNSGTLELNGVRATGKLFAKSDFGNVIFENGSAASVNMETNSGKVTVIKVNVRKELIIDNDFGDIELIQATATSYDLHTNSGSITIDGAKGEVKAYTDFGNIDIVNAQFVTLDLKTNSGSIDFSGSLGEGPHNVKSDFGNIDLIFPADLQLNVDLQTDFGNINSDMPITVTLNDDSSSDGGEIIGTINGGGAELIAHTNSGTINIKAIK